MRRREVVLGIDTCHVMEIIMKGVGSYDAVFKTLASHAKGDMLRLRGFRHVDSVPHVYDRFIGAWGMFPHHDKVPVYFVKQLYYDYVLNMHLDYISMPLTFYGSGREHSYEHPRAHKDPIFVLPPHRFFPHHDGVLYFQMRWKTHYISVLR